MTEAKTLRPRKIIHPQPEPAANLFAGHRVPMIAMVAEDNGYRMFLARIPIGVLGQYMVRNEEPQPLVICEDYAARYCQMVAEEAGEKVAEEPKGGFGRWLAALFRSKAAT
jgi:hypothetical protein